MLLVFIERAAILVNNYTHISKTKTGLKEHKHTE